MISHFSRYARCIASCFLLLCPFLLVSKPRLVLFVQEGLGHEMSEVARLYSEDIKLWDWRLDSNWTISSVSTLPLTTQDKPDGSDPEERPAYDVLDAWNGSLVELLPNQTTVNRAFKGYQWLIQQATDRNQAASALNSGIPTFNTAMNWLPYPAKSGTPMPAENLLLEWAHRKGLKTGVISDMPFTNSTNLILSGIRSEQSEDDFENFEGILNTSHLNLFVATGHPKYDELGKALSRPRYRLCSQNQWQDLRSNGRLNGWDVVFGDDNLMGISTGGNVSDKRLVIMQYGDTRSTQSVSTDSSGFVNNLNNSIRFQVKMALSYLDRTDDGFLLIVHLGRLPYLLKNELLDKSIHEVVSLYQYLTETETWFEANGGWGSSSLAMMSLYEYGLIWGADSSSFPYSGISDRGKKRLPGFRVNHAGPTASLAPILLRGSLNKDYENHVLGSDPIYGDYTHLTELYDFFRGIVKSSQ